MKHLFYFLFLIFLSIPISAQMMDMDASYLGHVAGLAYACKAGKSLTNFETISGYIIAAGAKDKADLAEKIKQYSISKYDTYSSQTDADLKKCPETLKQFKKQKIFDIRIHKNGKIKYPDGKTVNPVNQALFDEQTQRYRPH